MTTSSSSAIRRGLVNKYFRAITVRREKYRSQICVAAASSPLRNARSHWVTDEFDNDSAVLMGVK